MYLLEKEKGRKYNQKKELQSSMHTFSSMTYHILKIICALNAFCSNLFISVIGSNIYAMIF